LYEMGVWVNTFIIVLFLANVVFVLYSIGQEWFTNRKRQRIIREKIASRKRMKEWLEAEEKRLAEESKNYKKPGGISD